MDTENNVTRRPGRRPRQNETRTALQLPIDLLEWAKDEPEGFSGLVRKLLEEERKRRDAARG